MTFNEANIPAGKGAFVKSHFIIIKVKDTLIKYENTKFEAVQETSLPSCKQTTN